MADAKTEKQKVKEITDKLEEGLKELFDRDLPVYQLHEDGSETLIRERGRLQNMRAFSVLKKQIGRMKKACWRCRRNFRRAGQIRKHSFYTGILISMAFTS